MLKYTGISVPKDGRIGIMQVLKKLSHNKFLLALFLMLPCVCAASSKLSPLPAPEQITTKLVPLTISRSSVNIPQPLAAFVETILQKNPTMQAANAAISAAAARAKAAGYPIYNPSLAGEYQDSVDTTYSAGINQTIDWANKRKARHELGSANLIVARAEQSAVRLQLTSTILDAVVRYEGAKNVAKLAAEKTDILKQFVDLTKRRHQSGDVARVDVDLAQLTLSEAISQQADANIALNNALQVLRALSGEKEITIPSLPSTLPVLSVTQAEKSDLLEALPSVRVLESEYSSALARLRVAQRDRYADPTVGVQGGEEQTKEEGSGGLLSLTLNVPLYVRNPYRAEVTASNDDAIAAAQKRQAILQQANAEMESSSERYQLLRKSVAQWQLVSKNPLQDGTALVQRMWEAGEINTTDYLIQIKQRIDSQIAGIDLQYRAWQAWVEWLKASGTTEYWIMHKNNK